MNAAFFGLVIAWVVVVLSQAPENRPVVVRIGRSRPRMGQEVQADADDR